MIGPLIGAALAVVCGIVLALPFVRRRGAPREVVSGSSDILAVQRRREAVYEEIRQVQADFKAGLATGPQFREGLQALRQEAALLLMEEERLKRLAWDIEREVAARRVTGVPLDGLVACPECGLPVQGRHAVCPRCGAEPGRAASGQRDGGALPRP